MRDGRTTLLAIAVASGMACAEDVKATGPRIEVTKVQTLVDRDGRGFTRAPLRVQPLSGGRFALSEMNELPIVVDSTGALVKRWPKGRGPGEIGGMADFAVDPNDSLYVASYGQIVSVFDSELRFSRSFVLPEMGTPRLLWTSSGLLAGGYKISPASEGGGKVQVPRSARDDMGTEGSVLHLVGPDGQIVRSFLRDTLANIRAIRPTYQVANGGDNTVWVARARKHRLERLSLDGSRRLLIDTVPSWFTPSLEGRSSPTRIESIGEHEGVLWILSSVSRPDARERAEKAMTELSGKPPKYGSESDARLIPFEELATARLEAYDATTGRFIADLVIDNYPVAILDGGRFMIYTTSWSGNAQLEIWRMTARRQ